MATSRLARLFGRGKEQGADTAPPAYTGIGAPRPYDPPPGAPGLPPPPSGQAGPWSAPGPPRPQPQPSFQTQARPTDPAPTRVAPTVPGPRAGGQGGPGSAPSGQAPVVTRARYDEAARMRRAADQQVGILERQDAKLTEQIHHATEQERHDYVRELVARRIAVRSRLEESTLRRNRLRQTEDELGAGLTALDAPGRR